MNRSSAPWLAFIVVGLTFVILGASGKTAFLAIGAAFLILGFVGVARARKSAS